MKKWPLLSHYDGCGKQIRRSKVFKSPQYYHESVIVSHEGELSHCSADELIMSALFLLSSLSPSVGTSPETERGNLPWRPVALKVGSRDLQESLGGYQEILRKKRGFHYVSKWLTDYFRHGFNTLCVIKHVKTKFLSNEPPWNKIILNRGL